MICDKLSNINTPWIVSYDDNENIREIYKDYKQSEYSLNYSANRKTKGSEVIIYGNKIKLPD